MNGGQMSKAVLMEEVDVAEKDSHSRSEEMGMENVTGKEQGDGRPAGRVMLTTGALGLSSTDWELGRSRTTRGC